jgi:hypothetical protein
LDECGNLNAAVESVAGELDPDNFNFNFVGEGRALESGVIAEFKFLGLTCANII